jgi:hypothetical protein
MLTSFADDEALFASIPDLALALHDVVPGGAFHQQHTPFLRGDAGGHELNQSVVVSDHTERCVAGDGDLGRQVDDSPAPGRPARSGVRRQSLEVRE